MATAPVKPLHNFPLSLGWGTQTQPPYRPDSDSDLDPDLHSHHQKSTTVPPLLPPPPPPPRVGSRSARLHRFSFNSCLTSSIHNPNKSHKPPPSKSRAIQEKPKPSVGAPEGEEEEENSFRPWKLRPRNKNGNHNNKNGNVPVEVREPTSVVPVAPPVEPKSMRLRGIAESSGNGGGGLASESKKEKRKFWIALSREEIEEDVFSMTGTRPARRPTKRPKNVQRLLDTVFPGLWLVGTTADSYRLAETPVRVNKWLLQRSSMDA